MTKDPCSKEELYFTIDRAPKTSLDPGKEATMHCWAEQSADLCLEQGFSSQPVRYPGHRIRMNGLLYGVCRGQSQRAGQCGPVGLHLTSPLPPHQPFLDSFGFTYILVLRGNARFKSLPCKSRREVLLRQRRAALPAMLCPPKGTEPSSYQKSR